MELDVAGSSRSTLIQDCELVYTQVGPPSSPVELCREHGYAQKHSGSGRPEWQVSKKSTLLCVSR